MTTTLRPAVTRYLETLGPIDPSRYLMDLDGVPQQGKHAFADEKPYHVRSLLGAAQSNSKLARSAENTSYLTTGLSLAPVTRSGLTKNGKRVNTCPFASGVCARICLNDSGRGRVSRNVHRARVGKTRHWVRDPIAFKALLVKEVAKLERSARLKGMVPVVRLNVFSDVVWEREFPERFELFPDVMFYDYTKNPTRMGNTPANYHLTFSRSERNHEIALDMLANGVNVAIVFEDHSFPRTWNGFHVIDGTVDDLRILDPRGDRGVVVGLAEKDTEMHGPKYAGKRNLAIDTRGFVLPTATSNVYGQDVTLN